MVITISGGPGTGKTYAVSKTLNYVKLQQLRMAFTARAANAIQGRTIHSTVQLNWYPKSVYNQLEKKLENVSDVNECIEESKDLLEEFHYIGAPPDIIVVDEISMINGWTMYWLIRYFMDRSEKPLLFIMMGDKNQLCPVRCTHNLFSVTKLSGNYEAHYVNLLESKRFTEEYEGHINHLRHYVDTNDETGLFTYVCSHFPVVENIDSTLLSQASRAMAFTNSTVKSYNEFYVRKMVPGQTIRLYKCKDEVVKTEYLDVKRNCLIFVNENGHREVMNGTQLIFMDYDPEKDVIHCNYNGKRIQLTRNAKGWFPIDLGFAGTVHKFQGETIDCHKIVINFDGNQNLNLVYTALSRVRDMEQILAIKL